VIFVVSIIHPVSLLAVLKGCRAVFKNLDFTDQGFLACSENS